MPRKEKRAAAPKPRPIEYGEEIANRVLDGIIAGGTLRQVCAPDDMPDKSTVLRWVAKHEAFATLYALAQEAKMEGYADELLEIADDGSNDWMLDNRGDNPGYRENGEAMRRSALRIRGRSSPSIPVPSPMTGTPSSASRAVRFRPAPRRSPAAGYLFSARSASASLARPTR
jgi:hypothetical protein